MPFREPWRGRSTSYRKSYENGRDEGQCHDVPPISLLCAEGHRHFLKGVFFLHHSVRRVFCLAFFRVCVVVCAFFFRPPVLLFPPVLLGNQKEEQNPSWGVPKKGHTQMCWCLFEAKGLFWAWLEGTPRVTCHSWGPPVTLCENRPKSGGVPKLGHPACVKEGLIIQFLGYHSAQEKSTAYAFSVGRSSLRPQVQQPWPR